MERHRLGRAPPIALGQHGIERGPRRAEVDVTGPRLVDHAAIDARELGDEREGVSRPWILRVVTPSAK